jgi:hypothetical protein
MFKDLGSYPEPPKYYTGKLPHGNMDSSLKNYEIYFFLIALKYNFTG